MTYVSKEWKARQVEFAGRRKLTNVATGETTIVDVERMEGAVSEAGDAFSATNMNDLEQRISDEFGEVNKNLGGLRFGYTADGEPGVIISGEDGADTVRPFKRGGVTVLMQTLSLNAINSSRTTTFNIASMYAKYADLPADWFAYLKNLYLYFKSGHGNETTTLTSVSASYAPSTGILTLSWKLQYAGPYSDNAPLPTMKIPIVLPAD